MYPKITMQIFLLIIGIIFISACVQEKEPTKIETLVIWSFTDINDKVNVLVVLDEPVELKIGIINGIAPNTISLSEKDAYIRLNLLGAEYLSGDFEFVNEEIIYEGEVSKDIKYLTIKVKGLTEGKYPLTAELIIPGTYESKTLNFCIGKTLQKAIEFCTQTETTCETLECVQERMKTSSTQG